MFTISKTIARRSLLVAALVVAVGCTAPVAASATPASEAATWLGTQLKPSSTTNPAYCEEFSGGGASVGETLECSLAFDAAEMTSKRNATYDYAVEHYNAYIGSESCSEGGAMRAGSVAKFALVAEADGHDPENIIGKRNLIKDLECMQVSEGTEAGRFADKGETEDDSNTFTQSLAIIAMKACEEESCSSEPDLKSSIAKGTAYLRAQQCTGAEAVDGAFRSTIGLAASTCNTEAPFEPEDANAVEVDSTGAAVQALLAEGSTASKTTAEAAVEWLKRNAQTSTKPAGVFWENYCSESEAEFKTLFPSVNSTAQATMAYVADKASITEPKAWLTGIVEAQPAGGKGLPACTDSGTANVFATAQGIFGLEGTSYPTLAGL